MKLNNAFFLFIFFLLLISSCEKEGELEDVYPINPESKTEWLSRMNGDIESLRNIVLALQEKDSIEQIEIKDNVYYLKFLNNSSAEIILDNASYSAPMVGAHKIDDEYYWTKIIGTGTSSTTLIKNEKRENYKIIKDGITPRFDITKGGNWVLDVDSNQVAIYNQEGLEFRANGVKALFSSIAFDTDSNATIITNEVPARTYILPKFRPFTFRFIESVSDTLKVASGFTVPLDFISSGFSTFEYELPEAWTVEHSFSEDMKSGTLFISAPTGMEEVYDEIGSIKIQAVNNFGDKLPINIPVKSEIGLVNYASVEFEDIADGITISAASFVFADESLVNERQVTVIKAGDKYRLMLPEGYPILKKAIFTNEANGTFTYYFPPMQILTIGEQTLSLMPPQLLSYWQGGIIMEINESTPRIGIDAYNITGKVMAPKIGPNVPWFPNGNVDVTTAMSTTDGASNTAEIIKALGGPGTSAGFIARWPIRVTSGGYTDWYLPVAEEYLTFYSLFSPDKEAFNDLMEAYGGERFIYGQASGNHRNFWTSENISKTQAKMAVMEGSAGGTISPGTKVYGCRGLAFRKFN